MMKYFIILALMATAPFSSYAQCEGLEVTKDKFTDEVTVKSALILALPRKETAGKNVRVTFKKVVSPAQISYHPKSDTAFSLFLLVPGEKIFSDTKGAWLIFENGEKMQFPEAIAVQQYASGSSYIISMVPLDEEDVLLLGKHKITGIRIATSECEPSPWLGEAIRSQINCVVDKSKTL